MNQLKAVIAPLDPGEEPVSGVADKWICIVISIEIERVPKKEMAHFGFSKGGVLVTSHLHSVTRKYKS